MSYYESMRAEVARLRSRVGWLDHLDTAEGRAMHATEAVRVDCEQLRADLREALELLANVRDNEMPNDVWFDDRDALMEKHKNPLGLDLSGIPTDLQVFKKCRQENKRLFAEVEQLHDMLARLYVAVEKSAIGYGVYEKWDDISDDDLDTLRERMDEARAVLEKHKETP